MKKLLLIVLAVVAISCKETKPVDYVLFSGEISNPNSKTIRIINDANKSIKEITVSDEGKFADTIPNANGFYSFSDGVESSRLFLKDGYNLTLSMDAKQFDETIQYTGNGSKENNALAKMFLIFEEAGDTKTLYLLDEQEFLKNVNDQKEKVAKLFEGLDADFLKSEEVNQQYEYISKVKNFEQYHAYFSKNRDFKVSENFPDVLKDLKLDNEEHFKISKAYKTLVLSDFFSNARKEAMESKVPFQTIAIQKIKELNSEEIKNGILSNLAYEISSNNPNAKELYDFMMQTSKDELLKERITKQYNDIQKLAAGNPSPKFVGYEDNAGGKKSLDDFKGKYVYIDVWATWCGPCLGEIPHLQKVEKKFHGKNIEFVSISIDVESAHDKWKKMIVDKKLGGVQLIADNDWKSQFVREYGINGIPRFILVDPQGNIVNANAPRPSNPSLIQLFNELKI